AMRFMLRTRVAAVPLNLYLYDLAIFAPLLCRPVSEEKTSKTHLFLDYPPYSIIIALIRTTQLTVEQEIMSNKTIHFAGMLRRVIQKL
ncbi:MAG: hypothetical protein WBK62_05540, partial [Candidatus Fermentibacter daniensis]